MKRLGISLVLFIFTIQLIAQNYSKQDYIEKYCDLAVKEMKRVGIPASITLAQGMLESGNGNSTLAKKSNNHFGIKCHNDWEGNRVYHDDDSKGECFRKYKTVYESYIDHSDFLATKQRYASLFFLKTTDYKGWAHGLKKAGYATDPRYAKRLINIIEANDLDRFDSGKINIARNAKSKSGSYKTTGKSVDNFSVEVYASHKLGVNNGIKYITVKEQDSFSDICSEFGLKEWEIYAYNDLDKDAKINEYRYLYVQPKRKKAHRKHSVHRVKTGESLHYISQKYGVKLSRLYKINHLDKGDKIEEGQLIQLRKSRKG